MRFTHPPHGALAKWAGALALAVLLAACSETTPDPFEIDDVEEPVYELGTLEQLELGIETGALPAWGGPQLAPGDAVRNISGAYSQPCSINVGIAFDGTNLLMSCYNHPTLDVLSTTDGSLVGTLTVPGVAGVGAMAYDAANGTIWICTDPFNYGSARVAEYDPVTQSVLRSFLPPTGCADGLAYDGTDGTLYMSWDVEAYVHHVDPSTGTQIRQVEVRSLMGGFYGSSGIATGGPSIFLANNGGSQIWEAPKDFSSSSLFATFPRRIEDLECDDVTFAPDIAVIWQQDAYDRLINAFEIPAGACPFGGGGTIEVGVDIKPFSDPNSINPRSGGVVPVAILGSESFDVTDVDVTTLAFGPAGASPSHDLTDSNTFYTHTHEQVCDEFDNCVWEEYDANGDGIMDLVSHYVQRETGLAIGDTEACITGETTDGRAFEGCDAVRILER